MQESDTTFARAKKPASGVVCSPRSALRCVCVHERERERNSDAVFAKAREICTTHDIRERRTIPSLRAPVGFTSKIAIPRNKLFSKCVFYRVGTCNANFQFVNTNIVTHVT